MIITCQYCNKPARLIDSVAIYGMSYGMIWYCQPCNAYVSCKANSTIPRGQLANLELRQYRRSAHSFFDALWKHQGPYKRTQMYHWLAKEMKLSFKECHIGMFDVEQCRRVIHLTKERSFGNSST